MSEKRAKEIADSYEPGSEWTKEEDYYWTYKSDSRWGHNATHEVCYEPLDVL